MKLEELKNHMYDVMCVVDDICKKNNIRYFLDSGTEIGAVREHDFIPWDDDVDIKVLLEDYGAFKKAMEKDLPAYMHLVEPRKLSYWGSNVIRINDERFVIEEDDFHMHDKTYVGTDVFVFCPVANRTLSKMRVLLRTKLFYVLAMGHRYQIDYKKYPRFSRLVVFLVGKIGKLFSLEWLWSKNMKTFEKYKGCKDVVYFPFNYRIENISKMFFDADIFQDREYVSFRDRKFPIPVGYDKELTLQYGDYMTPHHDPSLYITHLHEESDE